MTASELQYREMSSSVLREYYLSNCHSPITIKGKKDSITGEVHDLTVPCGKCPHCVSTLQNEWVTRCLLETDQHKYCYFITLTYRPFDLMSLQRNSKRVPVELEFAALQKIHEETLSLEDADNYHKVFCLRPSVLDKKHMQNYWKRLRSGGDKCRFFQCGEYGHHYCAPHYHAIVWSDEPISRSHFQSAWSYAWTIDKDGAFVPYRGQKTKKYNIYLGNVQVQDLKESITKGTSKKAFSYVAKYVTKSEYNTSRVEAAWESLPDEHLITFNFSKYETENPQTFRVKTYKGFNYSKEQFIKLVRPFHVCSKRPSIGGVYLAQNLQRFSQRNFTIGETLGYSGLVFPRYFTRKTKEALYPIRIEEDAIIEPRRLVCPLAEFTGFWRKVYQLECLGLFSSSPTDFELQTLFKRVYSEDCSCLLFRYSRLFDITLRCSLIFVPDRMAFAALERRRGNPRPVFVCWLELQEFYELYIDNERVDAYTQILEGFQHSHDLNEAYLNSYASLNLDLFCEFRESALQQLHDQIDKRQNMYHLTHDTSIDYA